MQVRITMTLNVDPHAWLANKGIIVKKPRTIRCAAVRNDIKGYFEGLCQNTLDQLECAAKEDWEK